MNERANLTKSLLRVGASLLVCVVLLSCGRHMGYSSKTDPRPARLLDFVQVWCRTASGVTPALSLQITGNPSFPSKLLAEATQNVDGVKQELFSEDVQSARTENEVIYSTSSGADALTIDLTRNTSAFKYPAVLEVDDGAEAFDLECRVSLP